MFCGMSTPLGVREEKKSVAAMKAPKTQATVVKKPKTFWMRVKEECMVGDSGGARGRALLLIGVRSGGYGGIGGWICRGRW